MEKKSSEQVEALLRLFRERRLRELKVEEGEFRLHLRAVPRGEAAAKRNPKPAAVIAPAPRQVSREESRPAVHQGKGRTVAVRSPLIGVFYRAASPEAAPFVTLGEMVSEGQTVCIVEAMKVFNEIKAEWNGRVVATPADDGDLVQAGDPLIVLEFVDHGTEEDG
jgi:acetyl-CoA carboxylase biotin carboxyl carrier protein